MMGDWPNSEHRIGVIRHSEKIDKIIPALLAAQKHMENAVRAGTNPHFKSTYAGLDTVLPAAKLALNANDIVIIQGSSSVGREVSVTTAFVHTSCQWIEQTLTMTGKDEGPHAMGSCLTYGRRYGIVPLAAMGTADDDGNAGQGSGPVTSAEAPPPPAADRTKAFETAWDKAIKAVGEDDADVVVAMQGAFLYALTKGRTRSLTGLTDAELKTATNKLKGKKKDTVEWFTSGAWKISAGEPAGMQQGESGGDDGMQAAGPTCHECGKELTSAEADASASMPHRYCSQHLATGVQEILKR